MKIEFLKDWAGYAPGGIAQTDPTQQNYLSGGQADLLVRRQIARVLADTPGEQPRKKWKKDKAE